MATIQTVISDLRTSIINIQSQVDAINSKAVDTANLKSNYSDYVIKSNLTFSDMHKKLEALEKKIEVLTANVEAHNKQLTF